MNEISNQFATFYLGNRWCGIEVMKVQEVTKGLPTAIIPLSPPFVKGLINLRGQIATAISLKSLFNIEASQGIDDSMNVICQADGLLIAFLVDRVGDVVQVEKEEFEAAPRTIEPHLRKFITGVYKTSGMLLTVLGVEQIFNELNRTE